MTVVDRVAALRQKLASDGNKGICALASSLDDIQAALAFHWSQNYLPWFTDHGISHAKKVAEYALKAAEAPNLAVKYSLTPLEQYILAAAALLHDIGMNDLSLCDTPLGSMTPADADLVRHEHAARSGKLIFEDYRKWGLPQDQFLAEVVGLVAMAHGTKYYAATIPLLEERQNVYNQRVRSPLLAALVLMADELDLHYQRETTLPGNAKLNPISEAHAFKHRCLISSRIDFLSNGTIQIRIELAISAIGASLVIEDVEYWVVSKLRRQIGLTEAQIAEGFGRQVRFSRAIKVTRRNTMTKTKPPSLPASAVIRAEVSRDRVLDHKDQISATLSAMATSDIVNIVGRWDPVGKGDLDGREDVFRAVLATAQTGNYDVVVVSERSLLAGSADAFDVLEEWLTELQIQTLPPSKQESTDRELLLGLLCDALESKSAKRTLLAVSSVDGLSPPALRWLIHYALPMMVARLDNRPLLLITSGPDTLGSTTAMIKADIPVGTINLDQLKMDLMKFGDQDFVEPMVNADIGYLGLKKIVLQAEQRMELSQ